MKILLIPQKNNIKRIQNVVSKAGYANEVVENVETLIGEQTGVMVEIQDTKEILIVCGGFTKRESTYEIGITKIKE